MEEHSAAPAGGQEVVVVRLGGSRYALPMDAVAEVGRPPTLTRVPGLPSWLAGVANWRGRVLAVLDLRVLLGSPLGELGRHARLLVLHHGAVPVGLLAEAVEGTHLLADDQLEPALAHLQESAAGLLLGQATDDLGPCGLIDLDAVYRLAEALPRPRRAG